MSKKVILIILDGWGIAENPKYSAIDHAHIDYYWKLWNTYPHTVLEASGQAVGLPKGQMGNSEVGHMNLGAGRIVYQELERISKAFENKEVNSNPVLQNLIVYCQQNQKPLHLLGLVSDGGVHSHINHLKYLLLYLKEKGLKEVYVHAFLDGRDTDPKSGIHFIDELQQFMNENQIGKLASFIGRYYAMDRDKRWERVAKAYHLLVNGQGKLYNEATQALKDFYLSGVTDEFFEPVILEDFRAIQPYDAVLFFNFRTDRGRELTQALTQQDFPEQKMYRLPLYFVTLTRYDATFENVEVIFEKEDISETLGEVLSQHGKKQIRIAETEKYPHVTFFFNGGKEEPMEGEKRILCPSPKVATYDLKPEMSAYEVRDRILPEIQKAEADFICLNFANPDMVGHTGVWEAAIKACEVVIECLESIVEQSLSSGYEIIILADHGNVDKMLNEDGSPHTAHTTALVPCIFVSKSHHYALKKRGKLGDIAPTILKIMNLPIPSVMNGEVLIME
jgi:2,3-bisphosphoglycerate-independent phosphoglycerate mutase